MEIKSKLLEAQWPEHLYWGRVVWSAGGERKPDVSIQKGGEPSSEGGEKETLLLVDKEKLALPVGRGKDTKNV